MPEPDEHLDERLRAALGEVGDRARERIRVPGAGTVPPAARRRRAGLAGGTALALIAVGAAGWGVAREAVLFGQAAAPRCAPAEGRAFLPHAATDEQLARVGSILGRSPEVASYRIETVEENYDRFKWEYRDHPDIVNATKVDVLPRSLWFSLPCAGDFPAVRARLEPASDGVWCSCVPRDKPVLPPPTRTATPSR
ncbi:permease-like cell division protein FtsX [Dactylosporangium sp. NPDC051484]|uniref:permease-like cell division protein FtsX n=1 Tax=Dactylosporangium sp. NPDC051484 TaxID=3154942 RepID=UPI00344D9045